MSLRWGEVTVPGEFAAYDQYHPRPAHFLSTEIDDTESDDFAALMNRVMKYLHVSSSLLNFDHNDEAAPFD